jgi:hypothetical protein
MVIITLDNITNLNVSLQVGDLIYTTPTTTQPGAEDAQGTVGSAQLVGILRQITQIGNQVVLDVDETPFFNTVVPVAPNFIMFSKYNQIDGDVLGYYAQAKFINNSKEKAELFSVGSEVVINSK